MSGPFFPDNPNREARVKQLITQTTAIQSTFEQTETQIQGLTNIEPVFSALAKAAGYPTTEQYIQAGLASLTDAQKANYQHVCDNLLIHSPHLKNAMIATGIVGAIGTVVRVVPSTLVALSCKMGTFLHGVWGVLRGLIQIFKGAVVEGVALVREFATMIRVNWARKLVVGEEIMEKTATGLTWAKRAGKFLQWAGVIAEAALLIFSAVQGEKDRDTLRNAIIETCSVRFGAKKIQLLVSQSMIWTSKTAAIADYMNLLQDTKKEQEQNPSDDDIKLTDATISKSVLKKINDYTSAFDTDMANANPDSKVLGDLTILDTKDAGGAWRNEDPDLDAMKQWIADHPMKDNNGNAIPVDGPISGNTGLTWAASTVKGSAADQTVTVTGTNSTEKIQIFAALRVAVHITGTNAVFSNTSFKIAGTPDVKAGESTVAFSTGTATGASDVTVTRGAVVSGIDEQFAQVQVKVQDLLKPIEIPAKGGSVQFTLRGPTTAKGTANLLVEEDWWPVTAADKVWTDCPVVKS